jgi:hypothetical protein
MELLKHVTVQGSASFAPQTKELRLIAEFAAQSHFFVEKKDSPFFGTSKIVKY